MIKARSRWTFTKSEQKKKGFSSRRFAFKKEKKIKEVKFLACEKDSFLQHILEG